MNISQDLLKMSCFHDYAHLTDLFLEIQMGLQVCFSVEGEDNENNICCGVSRKFKIFFFSHPVKDQQIVLMLMRYFVPSRVLVGSEWGHLRTCHTFCFFFS